jgi:hypothetical protein
LSRRDDSQFAGVAGFAGWSLTVALMP